MNVEKLISVIVPIYNVEKYLEKCINSIIGQTYKKLEIILIDDGSTDNSGKICDSFAQFDKRIIVIHKKNEGLSSARNKGLDIAKGELISFVDSDDYLELNMLEELKNNMENYNSDISVCDFFKIRNNKKNQSNINYKKYVFSVSGKDKFCNIQNEYGILTDYAWNKLYKKKIFTNIRYPKSKIFEDSYILCDILDRADIVSYDLKPLYNYVYRDNSIMNSFAINHFDRIDAYNKNIIFFESRNYYDLVSEEYNRKMTAIIIRLAKMKRYGIKDKEIEKKYYQELINTNKEVKWKGATKYNKFYKVFRKPSISILACMLRVRDLIKK